MSDRRGRLQWYLVLVATIIVVYALIYSWGMATLEGRPRTFLEALEIVVQTFTTTGYGEDAPWDSSTMQILVIAMQVTGVTLLFLTVPLFVGPWAEERLRQTPPTSIGRRSGHVVLCELTSRGETVINELRSWDRDYVIVEPDRDRALELHGEGLTVVTGDPESTEVLRAAHLDAATHVIVDAPIDHSASIVLSAREVSSEARVIAFAEDPDMETYLRYAGADEVYSPRYLLGESLANKVTSDVSLELGDTVDIGADFELVEMPVQPGCGVEGSSIAESGIRAETGASIIGLWDHGDFVPAPDPGTMLDANTILLVAGSESQLEALKRLTLSEVRRRPRGTVIVAGHGDVGSTVSRAIVASEMDLVSIDIVDKPGVDIVGDATDEDVLREAGVAEADALILALADDTSTMFATLVAREISRDIQILARADETASVGKMYRAGADYVVALDTVSGRIIASSVLEEEVIAPESQVELVRTPAPRLAGQSLREADVRHRTGATVIAVERDGSVLTDLDPEFVIQRGDRLIIAGTDEATNAFNEMAR